MPKKVVSIPVILVLITMFASACSPSLAALPAEASNAINTVVDNTTVDKQDAAQTVPQSQPLQAPTDPGLLAAYENTLINIYEQVNPSVVNIRVVSQDLSSAVQLPDLFPNLPQSPNTPQTQPPTSQSLGSGFVWDTEGHIITNNHVVEGAEKIEVTFSDETVATAELVGTDPDSDLAVIRVDLPPDKLKPIVMGDSDALRVGQLAIAIGNPFGLEGTMTVGIISALGRSLPASDGVSTGPVYSIPDVIQTDAPINPGNSGGVLLDDSGQVIGVTAAIESPVRANAGIGFVIPASIVNQVVPDLIEKGSYEHPYLGISGISLFPDLAEAMNLDRDQRGAMVATVNPNGPADKAGLQGSDRQVTIDGSNVDAGGDVITSINGQPVNDMDDLIAYLSANSLVGQSVTLTVLRNGQEIKLSVTLEARPKETAQAANPPTATSGRAWLGIIGIPLNADIAGEMGIAGDQTGVLVVEVQDASPAQEAGLKGGDQTVTINGETIPIGGDVIVRADGNDVQTVQELAAYLQEVGVGGQVSLTVLRDGNLVTIEATLGEQP